MFFTRAAGVTVGDVLVAAVVSRTTGWLIDMTRTNRPDNGLKLPAALLGASAVIAMGVIGLTYGGTSEGQTAVISVGSMSTGETTTVTHSGTIAPVVNVPPVKATFFGES
jgi:hypothetical protein